VKLALGEVSIVSEIKEFLLANDVALDSFSQVRLKIRRLIRVQGWGEGARVAPQILKVEGSKHWKVGGSIP